MLKMSGEWSTYSMFEGQQLIENASKRPDVTSKQNILTVEIYV